MAIIKRKDIIEVDAVLNDLKAIRTELDKLTKSTKALQTQKRSSNELSTGAEAKKAIDLTKQLETATAKLASTQTKEAQQLAKLKALQAEENKILRTQAKEAIGLTGAYEKQSRQLNEMRKAYKDLILIQGKETAQTKKLGNEITKLDKKLKKVDATVGQHQRSVGKYGDALKGVGRQLLGAAGIVGGVQLLTDTVKQAINIFVDFEKSSSRLAAILGKSKQEIKALTDQAKLLGSTTAFTASEVISLQTELAKLGFTTKQIEASTEGILNLAAATGSDLASSAELAGSTLRIFNLDASEMSRVSDVLAKSTTISSLSMEKLATIMPTVGKTAQLAGVSLEKTAALAGTLTDRGLDASSAATSLRNIFLELSKKGLTWEQAMTQINNSTDKNKTAMDLFGKRAAAAGAILAETATDTDKLTEALNKAEGAAQKMADVMLDNLAGDITKAKSAWEGYVLSIEDGEGKLSKAIRSVVVSFTDLLSTSVAASQETATFEEKLENAFNTANEGNIIVRQLTRLWDGLVTTFKQAKNAILDLLGIEREHQKGIKITNDRTKIKITRTKQDTEATKENTTETKKSTTSKINYNKELREQIRLLNNVQREIDNIIETEKRADAAQANILLGGGVETRTGAQVGITEQVANPLTGSFSQELVDEASDLTDLVNQNIIDSNDARRASELEKEKEQQDAILSIKEAGITAFTDLASNIFSADQDERLANIKSGIEAEKDALKDKLDKGIINETEYKRKLAELNKKERIAEGKAEKRKALFDIAIKTAVAIVGALPNLIKAGSILAIGAIQAASVAATPIPGFKEGVVGFKGKGTDTSDSNTVKISNNESVITAKGTSNAPLALEAINRGVLSDKDINQNLLRKSQNQFNMSAVSAKIDKTNQLLANLGFQADENGIKTTYRADGSIKKHYGS